MINAQQENARMLASAIGFGEDDASERLAQTVLITVAADPISQRWAREIIALLERTLKVTTDSRSAACLEVVIGRVAPATKLKCVYAALDATRAVVDLAPVTVTGEPPHPLFATVTACSVVAAALFLAVDADGLPNVIFPTIIPFDQLGISAEALARPLDLNGAVLIGAGAVGNAFLRALRHVDARGKLPIIDPKKVGGGNPNRCLYLTDADIGRDKATALASNGQSDFLGVKLAAFVEDFHSYVEREGVQRTAIVTTDSRRVRRSIQSEVPGRVFDASTTDIQAVVVHSHQQPTSNACMACIYRHVPDENAREQAIADGLGISLEMVKESLISQDTAEKISALHPKITASDIKGMAFDSLFKQLCGEQALRTPEGRQVLAPFAFVSALAGALLVIEMLRAEADLACTNYWQVDPWRAPISKMRRLKPRVADCEFCSKPHALAVVNKLWPSATAIS